MKFLPALVLFFVAMVATHAEAAALTREKAIQRAQRESGGKVLSSETKQVGKQTIYRIKVLTRDGKVKVIEVPADDQADAANKDGQGRR